MSLIREEKEVCIFCFNASKHKPKPRLCTVESTEETKGSKERRCKQCNMDWKRLHVVRGTNNKWFPVRPRPARVSGEYQVCTYRDKCQKGAACTFAHSNEELEVWRRERMAEQLKSGGDVRPFPDFQAAGVNASSEIILQLCKNYLMGSCTYGKRCTFAHSEPELRTWSEHLQTRKRSDKTGGPTSTTLSCPLCQVPCNSFQMLAEHLAGQKHAARVEQERERHLQQQRTAQLQQAQQPQYVPQPQQRAASTPSGMRPPPSMPWIREYRMCWYTEANRRCPHGNSCTYAHSHDEQLFWSSKLPKSGDSMDLASSDAQHATGKGASARSAASQFVRQLRQEITRSNPSATEFLQDKDGVSIQETSGTALSVDVTSRSNIKWVFHITFSRSTVFQAVILLDSTLADFTLHSAVHVKNMKVYESVTDNDGVFINQRVNDGDVYEVTVQCKPAVGKREQCLLVRCGNFVVGRLLSVSHLSSQLSDLIQDAKRFNLSQSRLQSINSRSLFWEENFETVAYDDESQARQTLHFPKYELKQEIEENLLQGVFDSKLRRGLSQAEYKYQLHTLLYIEEYQRRHDIKRYDIYNEQLDLIDKHTLESGALMLAAPGHKLCNIKLKEPLDDREHSLSPSSVALVRPHGSNTVYEAPFEHLGRDYVVLKLNPGTLAACANNTTVDIRFRHYRQLLQSMHHAVDNLDLGVVFPKLVMSNSSLALGQANFIDVQEDLSKSPLNDKQREVVATVLQDEQRQIPTLLCGPFGTGKTKTLVEAVLQLMKHAPTAKVLLTTHVNFTADSYVRELHERWSATGQKKAPMLRLYAVDRRLNTIDKAVHKYCCVGDGGLYTPSLEHIQQFQVVVTTTENAYVLSSLGMPKSYFTHIIVDEACQIMEAECLIPVSLGHVGTKIVLAGDHMQMEPAVHSLLARRFDLHRSLLDRMYDNSVYESYPSLRADLADNYRCVPEILKLPSELFYNNKLNACYKRTKSGPDLPAMVFRNVRGQEMQDADSPSYYNVHEAAAVVEAVEQLVNSDNGLPAEDVCVVSPYTKQVQFIRSMLRPKRLGRVNVLSMRQMQGHEFRAIILSTVRSCDGNPNVREDSPHLGFLSNPKLFNTAITRAREWLIVVGDAFTLASVGSNRSCWLKFMRLCRESNSFHSDDKLTRDFESQMKSSVDLRARALVAASAHHLQPSEERPVTPAMASDPKVMELLRNPTTRRGVMWPWLEPLVRELDPKRYHEITAALLGLAVEDVLMLQDNKELRNHHVKLISKYLDMGLSGDAAVRTVQQEINRHKQNHQQLQKQHWQQQQQAAAAAALHPHVPHPHGAPPAHPLAHLPQTLRNASAAGHPSQLPGPVQHAVAAAQPDQQLFGLLPGQNPAPAPVTSPPPPPAAAAAAAAPAPEATETEPGVAEIKESYALQCKLTEELHHCSRNLLMLIHHNMPQIPSMVTLQQVQQQQIVHIVQLRNHQQQCFNKYLSLVQAMSHEAANALPAAARPDHAMQHAHAVAVTSPRAPVARPEPSDVQQQQQHAGARHAHPHPHQQVPQQHQQQPPPPQQQQQQQLSVLTPGAGRPIPGQQQPPHPVQGGPYYPGGPMHPSHQMQPPPAGQNSQLAHHPIHQVAPPPVQASSLVHSVAPDQSEDVYLSDDDISW